MRLQCYASSVRSRGILPGTAPTLPSIRAPRSAYAAAKANAQLLGWRTTTGDTASSQTLASPRSFQPCCWLPILTLFCAAMLNFSAGAARLRLAAFLQYSEAQDIDSSLYCSQSIRGSGVSLLSPTVSRPLNQYCLAV